MCYSASGFNQCYTHPTSCLECANRGKMIFCLRCCYYLVSSNNVNSVMAPITSGMHHIPFPPAQRACGEVPGTAEHPQSSLECMCHDGINPQPWLMLYIYNHPSQHCHHNSQKTQISSWTVWADPARLCNSWYVQRPQGPFSVCSRVVETSNGLRLKLESLSFCCALSSLTAQRRDRVWCVFWRPAALSTLRPQHWHYGSWAPQGDREGRGGREGWVTAAW